MAMTKAQIRNKINILKKEKNNYSTTKNSYRTSLSYAKTLVNSLNNSKSNLISAYDNMRKYYIVDGKTADNGKIIKNKESIEQIIKELNNTIIPSINNNIKNLDYKINSINIQIQQLNREYNLAEI